MIPFDELLTGLVVIIFACFATYAIGYSVCTLIAVIWNGGR